jgi:RNA-directed DNA polymerase
VISHKETLSNYFAVGHSGECFNFIRDWVEKKVRRHMGRPQKRKGFGWKRWSKQWMYESLRLFNGYLPPQIWGAFAPKAPRPSPGR